MPPREPKSPEISGSGEVVCLRLGAADTCSKQSDTTQVSRPQHFESQDPEPTTFNDHTMADSDSAIRRAA